VIDFWTTNAENQDYNLKEITKVFKKIILGALLIGVIGVLIAGAVMRTSATSGERAGENGRRGRATEVVTADASQQNYGENWTPGGAVEQTRGRQGSGRGSQGGQAVVGDGQGAPLADVAAEDWLVVTGTVVSAADDLVEIKTDAGDVIPFEGRPLSFAAEQGFRLKAGDEVTLDGYDENGEFKIGKVTNPNSGVSITLRDASGRPSWAGRGRQG
jgi:hypothetical protein